MNIPVVFKDPDSGELLEVVEAKAVSIAEIDSRIEEANRHIKHFQDKIEDLKALRAKVDSFNNPAAVAEPQEPAESLAPQVPNSQPLELSQNPTTQESPPISA